MIAFTTSDSFGLRGENVILYGNDLRLTPWNNSSRLLFNICPVDLAITLSAVIFEPNAPTAAPEIAALIAFWVSPDTSVILTLITLL